MSGQSQDHLSVSALYLESQLETLDAMGFARTEAVQILDMQESDLDDPRFRMSLSKLNDLYCTASDVMARPQLGLEVGFEFRVSSFAKSGRLYAFCRDLVQVVEMNGRYQPLAISAGDVSYFEDNGRCFLEFSESYEGADSYRHITELIFGSYGTAFRWLNWGSGQGNKAAFFKHSAPDDLAIYERVFQCPVHFDSPQNRLEFPANTVHQPLPTADAGKLALTCEMLDKLMERTVQPSDVETAARASIRHCLRERKANLHCVSQSMGRTERQLRTDLKSAGLNFRVLLDEVRQEIYHHQRGRGMSYALIAQELGYNDQAAFTRAFKRWYGVAPGAHSRSKSDG